jgi:hypothetical protein
MEKQENLEKLLELIKCQIAEQFLNQKPKSLEIQLNYDGEDRKRFGKSGGGKTLEKILENYDSIETYYEIKYQEWISTMDTVRRYFDFSNRKELKYQPNEYKYYCFHCDKKLTRKQSRRHRLKNHLVVKLTEPKPKIIQDQQKFQKSIETKSFLEPFNIPRCYYCSRVEKDDFPLTRKVIGYQEIVDINGNLVEKPIEIPVCAICYYQRFGKRPLSGNKNPIVKEKISKFLWIQRNYVINLKNIKSEELAEITNRIRINIKYQIEQKLLNKGIREPEYSKLLEKELRDRLSRSLILC